MTAKPGSKKIFSLFWKIICLFLIVTVLAGWVFHRELIRLYHVMTLFDKDKIVYNFSNMDTILNTREIKKGTFVYNFKKNPKPLPQTFTYKNQSLDTMKFLEDTWTTGLLVIKDDTVIYESYFKGNTPASRSISWSMGKSIVSALVGIAVQEGKIRNLDTHVSDYVPSLKKADITACL